MFVYVFACVVVVVVVEKCASRSPVCVEEEVVVEAVVCVCVSVNVEEEDCVWGRSRRRVCVYLSCSFVSSCCASKLSVDRRSSMKSPPSRLPPSVCSSCVCVFFGPCECLFVWFRCTSVYYVCVSTFLVSSKKCGHERPDKEKFARHVTRIQAKECV